MSPWGRGLRDQGMMWTDQLLGRNCSPERSASHPEQGRARQAGPGRQGLATPTRSKPLRSCPREKPELQWIQHLSWPRILGTTLMPYEFLSFVYSANVDWPSPCSVLAQVLGLGRELRRRGPAPQAERWGGTHNRVTLLIQETQDTGAGGGAARSLVPGPGKNGFGI